MKKNSLIKKADVIILIGVLILSGLSIYFIKDKSDNPVAYIYKETELIEQIELKNVQKPYDLKISNNGYNVTIKVENGVIYYEDANCSDKICVNSGKLKKNGDTAICVPSKTMIVVKSNNDSVYLTY